MRLIDADALTEIFADRMALIAERYGVDSSEAGILSGAYKLLGSMPTITTDQHWIPCSERLPKKEYKEQRRGVYLTTNAYGVVGTTKYEFDGDFGFVGWGTNIPSDIRIIAWMPLPEPYKGE